MNFQEENNGTHLIYNPMGHLNTTMYDDIFKGAVVCPSQISGFIPTKLFMVSGVWGFHVARFFARRWFSILSAGQMVLGWSCYQLSVAKRLRHVRPLSGGKKQLP